jgi:hypothetical protein
LQAELWQRAGLLTSTALCSSDKLVQLLKPRTSLQVELRRRAGIPTSAGTLISTALPTVGHQRLAGMAARPADKVSTPGARANARTKKKGEMKMKAAAIGAALQRLLANPMESAGCMRFRCARARGDCLRCGRSGEHGKTVILKDASQISLGIT